MTQHAKFEKFCPGRSGWRALICSLFGNSWGEAKPWDGTKIELKLWVNKWTLCRKEYRVDSHVISFVVFPQVRFGSKLQQLLHQLTCNSPDLSILHTNALLTLSVFLFISLLQADIPAWLCIERRLKSAVCYLPLTLSFVLSILGDSKEYSSFTHAAEFHLSGWRQKFTVLPYLHSGHVFGIGTFWVQPVAVKMVYFRARANHVGRENSKNSTKKIENFDCRSSLKPLFGALKTAVPFWHRKTRPQKLNSKSKGNESMKRWNFGVRTNGKKRSCEETTGRIVEAKQGLQEKKQSS